MVLPTIILYFNLHLEGFFLWLTIVCFSYGLYTLAFLNTKMFQVLKYFPQVVNIQPFLGVPSTLFPSK